MTQPWLASLRSADNDPEDQDTLCHGQGLRAWCTQHPLPAKRCAVAKLSRTPPPLTTTGDPSVTDSLCDCLCLLAGLAAIAVSHGQLLQRQRPTYFFLETMGIMGTTTIASVRNPVVTPCAPFNGGTGKPLVWGQVYLRTIPFLNSRPRA